MGYPTYPTSLSAVTAEVVQERQRQDARWGEQNHPDGTGFPGASSLAAMAKEDCEAAFAHGAGTWLHILQGEVSEAFAEESPPRLREELLQVAAVAIAWVEALDRRGAEA